ncbi:MAG: hypothetical protein ACRDLB_02865 [Actinomycetota bacterium]
MKKIALVLCLLVAGSACSSAAAPGAEEVVAQVDKATSVEVEGALRNAAVAEETYFTEALTYTKDLAALQQVGFDPPAGVQVRVMTAGGTSFCIEASTGDEPMHIGTPEVTPLPGVC